MFNQMLVPLDGSALAECVLPHVVAFTRSFDVHITLLRVLEQNHGVANGRPIDPLDWQMRKAEAEVYLDNQTNRLRELGLEVTSVVLEGEPARLIVEYAHDHAINLLILSSHGQSGLSRWNVSAVVQKIIQYAAVSVLIVRAYRAVTEELSDLRYQRLLVPLDGSLRADCVLAPVAKLARSHEAMVLVAHVVHRPEMAHRGPPSQEDLELAEHLIERNRQEAARYLEQLPSWFSGNVQKRILVSDNVDAALHDLVETDDIDLVVLSAHGYSGVNRWPLGSLTTNFLVYGATPLLIVQDFEPDEVQPTAAAVAAGQQGTRSHDNHA